jgi:hypothetical protein
MDQVNSFNFLGNLTSCEKEVEIDKKMNKYLKKTGVSNNMLTTQTLKENKNKTTQYTSSSSSVIQQ